MEPYPKDLYDQAFCLNRDTVLMMVADADTPIAQLEETKAELLRTVEWLTAEIAKRQKALPDIPQPKEDSS